MCISDEKSIFSSSGEVFEFPETRMDFKQFIVIEKMLNTSESVVTEFSSTSGDTFLHGLGSVTFWGAQTYMYVNIVHFFICIFVVIIYHTQSKVKRNLYNRAVLRHNASLLTVGGLLTLLGYCNQNCCYFGELTIRLVWLILQYFTNSTVFWLNVVCFDMMLTITCPSSWVSVSEKRDNEEKKLSIYSVVVWGGALLPTATAAVFEFVPQVPSNLLFLKANYTEASNGPRPVVNMYFFLLPALTLLCNNALFAFTTYNIIRVRRNTQLVTNNQKRVLHKKYFLFLRLYLLMGAPWFFGTALACVNKLAVLKVCRLLQPVLWLVTLTSRAQITHQLTKLFKRKRTGKGNATEFTATGNSKAEDGPVFVIIASSR